MAKEGKLRESVEALANPGEQVLAAVCVQPKGQGNAGAVGGIAGAVIAGKGGKETVESSQQTGIEIPRFAALAITPQRLLILKMNAMGSKADQIVSEVPISEVDGLSTGKSLLRKNVTLMARGGTFEFECHKSTPVDTLTDALDAARSGR